MTDKEKIEYFRKILQQRFDEAEANMKESREEGRQNTELLYLGEMVAYEGALDILKIVCDWE